MGNKWSEWIRKQRNAKKIGRRNKGKWFKQISEQTGWALVTKKLRYRIVWIKSEREMNTRNEPCNYLNLNWDLTSPYSNILSSLKHAPTLVFSTNLCKKKTHTKCQVLGVVI